jgi:arginine exporter protein ArgO
MMLVTKILKKTIGEDNKKTEMYNSALSLLAIDLNAHLLITNQVYDSKSLCKNWSHCISRNFCQCFNVALLNPSLINNEQSWLWSTALLGSSFVGYDYGVAGPFWFAAGCSPMIVFFALLGISCKRKIPEAHTSLEVVRIRYGMVQSEKMQRKSANIRGDGQ